MQGGCNCICLLYRDSGEWLELDLQLAVFHCKLKPCHLLNEEIGEKAYLMLTGKPIVGHVGEWGMIPHKSKIFLPPLSIWPILGWSHPKKNFRY